MSPKFNKFIPSPVEQEILDEERKYEAAFKKGEVFHVLKEIRTKIKVLKSELSEQRRYFKKGE